VEKIFFDPSQCAEYPYYLKGWERFFLAYDERVFPGVSRTRYCNDVSSRLCRGLKDGSFEVIVPCKFLVVRLPKECLGCGIRY
jgi:hypothetical protein